MESINNLYSKHQYQKEGVPEEDCNALRIFEQIKDSYLSKKNKQKLIDNLFPSISNKMFGLSLIKLNNQQALINKQKQPGYKITGDDIIAYMQSFDDDIKNSFKKYSSYNRLTDAKNNRALIILKKISEAYNVTSYLLKYLGNNKESLNIIFEKMETLKLDCSDEKLKEIIIYKGDVKNLAMILATLDRLKNNKGYAPLKYTDMNNIFKQILTSGEEEKEGKENTYLKDLTAALLEMERAGVMSPRDFIDVIASKSPKNTGNIMAYIKNSEAREYMTAIIRNDIFQIKDKAQLINMRDICNLFSEFGIWNINIVKAILKKEPTNNIVHIINAITYSRSNFIQLNQYINEGNDIAKLANLCKERNLKKIDSTQFSELCGSINDDSHFKKQV